MRVLFLTHRLPYAPNRGDRIRSYYILNALRGHASVDLVSLVHDAEEASHVEELGGLVDTVYVAPVGRWRNRIRGAATLATSIPLTHVLLDSPFVLPLLERIVAERRPDVVLAFCSGMARFALEPPLAGLPLVIELVDADSVKWKTLAATRRGPLAWIYRREARCLARFEARAIRSAFATTVVNDRERAALKTFISDGAIEALPSGVDLDYWRPRSGPSSSQDVVFCGVMNYPPNEEGAIWLAQEVWPQVRQHCPAGRLRLVGSQPTKRLLKICATDDTIEVTGAVADVRPYLWEAAVAAAPLAQAHGVQNKVLEAIAAGVPAVITPAVAAGLPPEILRACQTADSATRFANAVVAGLQLEPAQRRAAAESVDLTRLAWRRRLSPLVELLQAAAAGEPVCRSAAG